MQKLLIAAVLGALLIFSPRLSDAQQSHSFMLSNSMQVVVVPNQKIPAVTHMVWYKVGAIDEAEGKSGIAHFFEHLMFKGTEKYGPGQFSKIIAEHGGNDNAFTSYDYTAYHQTIAKKYLPLVMEMEADRMTGLILNEEAINTEREVILEERRSRLENSPIALLTEKMRSTLYKNNPYGITTIGLQKDIKNITLDDLKTFYKTYYTPNNAILMVSGDITTNEVKTLAEKHYGVLSPSNLPNRPNLSLTTETEETQRIEYKDPRVTQPEWISYYLTPSLNTENAELAYPLIVLAQILGGGKTSRLYQSLVIEHDLASGAFAYYDDTALGPSLLTCAIVPTPKTKLEAIETVYNEEISTLLEKGITEKELSRAKEVLKAEAIYARDGLKNIATIYGRSLAQGLDTNYVEQWPEHINSVTAEQVKRAAEHIFKTHKKQVIGVLQKEN